MYQAAATRKPVSFLRFLSFDRLTNRSMLAATRSPLEG